MPSYPRTGTKRVCRTCFSRTNGKNDSARLPAKRNTRDDRDELPVYEKHKFQTTRGSDPDYFGLANENSLSSLVVPIIHNGYIEGMIVINSEVTDAFHSADVALAETAAAELERAWERSSYHQHLTEIIQAGISLSTMMEPRAVVQEIATRDAADIASAIRSCDLA